MILVLPWKPPRKRYFNKSYCGFAMRAQTGWGWLWHARGCMSNKGLANMLSMFHCATLTSVWVPLGWYPSLKLLKRVLKASPAFFHTCRVPSTDSKGISLGFRSVHKMLGLHPVVPFFQSWACFPLLILLCLLGPPLFTMDTWLPFKVLSKIH